jgi:hypothetical protein
VSSYFFSNSIWWNKEALTGIVIKIKINIIIQSSRAAFFKETIINSVEMNERFFHKTRRERQSIETS